MTTPANDKSSLWGKQPPVFDETRLKADNFWRAFKIYCILNKDTNTIKSPFNRAALAISFIAGPNVNNWAKHQLDQLEEKMSLTNPNHYAETDEQLWTEFETAFQATYQDTTQAQDAYTALMQLEMKGWDINMYIATFDWLIAQAGWSTSDKGVMEKFRNGLVWWLALNIMHKYDNIPATLDDWKAAAKKEILRRAQIKAEMPSRNPAGMPYPVKPFQKFNNQPRNNIATRSSQPYYIPMDVDVAWLGGPLTSEERKRLLEENRCFYCQDKGHRAAKCWKKPNVQQQTNNPFTSPRETNPFHARATTMEQTETANTTPPATAQTTTSREQVLSCLKNLSKEEYNDVLNKMMTEDF